MSAVAAPVRGSFYAELFRELQPGYDPRHIEAYVRLGHATLNGLSREELAFEAEVSARCIDVSGTETAEELAQTFGL